MEQIGSAYYLRHHALNLPPGVVRLDVGPLVGEHLVGVRLGFENVAAVLVVVVIEPGLAIVESLVEVGKGNRRSGHGQAHLGPGGGFGLLPTVGEHKDTGGHALHQPVLGIEPAPVAIHPL